MNTASNPWLRISAQKKPATPTAVIAAAARSGPNTAPIEYVINNAVLAATT